MFQKSHKEKQNFQQTKSTLFQKIRNLQSLTINGNKRTEQIKNLLQTKRTNIFSEIHKNKNYEENKYALNGKSRFPQISFKGLVDKFEVHRQNCEDQIGDLLERLNCIEQIYDTKKQEDQQNVRKNFVRLEKLQKQCFEQFKMIQDNHQLTTQAKSILMRYVQDCHEPIKTKHQQRLQNSLKSLFIINQESSLLKLHINKQSSECENEWCQSLDHINDCLIMLSNQMNKLKQHSHEKCNEIQWNIKEIQLNALESLEKEIKERQDNQLKLHQVMSKLIEKVADI